MDDEESKKKTKRSEQAFSLSNSLKLNLFCDKIFNVRYHPFDIITIKFIFFTVSSTISYVSDSCNLLLS